MAFGFRQKDKQRGTAILRWIGFMAMNSARLGLKLLTGILY
jgi:hypothetical protein